MPKMMPGMLRDSPSRARQRRSGLFVAALISIGIAVRAEFFGSTKPTALSYFFVAFIVVANAVVAFFGLRAHEAFLVRPVRRSRLGRRGREGVPRVPGPAVAGPVPEMAGHWPVIAGHWPALRAASRLMPGAAGRRWLAEASSLLSEVDAGRRRTAARSYLRSAPRLVLLMWVAELSRRARRHLR
jgi:hypothetical protein